MIPELFKIGSLTVYSYGLMLGISFIVASWLLNKELERRNLPEKIGTEVTLIAIIFGIIGSKGAHLIENWDKFVKDPVGMAFNAGGLTFYGGLILTTIVLIIYFRVKKMPFLYMADLIVPSLAIAYGIGRIGCHLAGDGDYGFPTNLPWGTDYSNGTVPPSLLFMNTEYAGLPDNTPLHPTPVYEFIMAAATFALLYYLRKKKIGQGKVFMTYLVLTGVARFFVEFLRWNPKLMLGLSEAQLISVVMVAGGLIGYLYLTKNPMKEFTPPQPAQPELVTTGKKKHTK